MKQWYALYVFLYSHEIERKSKDVNDANIAIENCMKTAVENLVKLPNFAGFGMLN